MRALQIITCCLLVLAATEGAAGQDGVNIYLNGPVNLIYCNASQNAEEEELCNACPNPQTAQNAEEEELCDACPNPQTDIDECSTCGPTEECIKSHGGYKCEKVHDDLYIDITCGDGDVAGRLTYRLHDHLPQLSQAVRALLVPPPSAAYNMSGQPLVRNYQYLVAYTPRQYMHSREVNVPYPGRGSTFHAKPGDLLVDIANMETRGGQARYVLLCIFFQVKSKPVYSDYHVVGKMQSGQQLLLDCYDSQVSGEPASLVGYVMGAS